MNIPVHWHVPCSLFPADDVQPPIMSLVCNQWFGGCSMNYMQVPLLPSLVLPTYPHPHQHNPRLDACLPQLRTHHQEHIYFLCYYHAGFCVRACCSWLIVVPSTKMLSYGDGGHAENPGTHLVLQRAFQLNHFCNKNSVAMCTNFYKACMSHTV